MTPAEALKQAQTMLADYNDCVYDRHAWATVVRALEPIARNALAYHDFIHQYVCGDPMPLNLPEIDEQRLWALLKDLCDAARDSPA